MPNLFINEWLEAKNENLKFEKPSGLSNDNFNPHLFTELLNQEQHFKLTNPLGFEERSELLYSLNDTDSSYIRVYRDVYNNGNKRLVSFVASFTPEEWILKGAFKPSNAKYYANDITRLQYLKVAYKNNFLGFLPNTIILHDIINCETLKALKSSNPENLQQNFWPTIHGKRLKYLLQDFGLTALHLSHYTHPSAFQPDIMFHSLKATVSLTT